MTAKKKRLLFMVLGVCLCVLLAVVIGDFAILENRKENVEKLNQFTGIWTDKDKHFSMEVRRVTADAIFFSLDENRNRLFAGRAIGDETYEFTYKSTGNEYLMQSASETAMSSNFLASSRTLSGKRLRMSLA